MEGIVALWVIVILILVFIIKEIRLGLFSKCPKCKQTGASRKKINSSENRYKVFLQCNTCGHSYNVSYKIKSGGGSGGDSGGGGE